MIKKISSIIHCIVLLTIFHPVLLYAQKESKDVYPGADEKTPSLSQYFSWVNNTNEGSTESQTLINLDFFRWLKDEYGMTLDIYLISAGALDKPFWYGRMESEEFRRQFPRGFGPIYRKAKQISLRCVSSETVFGVLGMSLLKSPVN